MADTPDKGAAMELGITMTDGGEDQGAALDTLVETRTEFNAANEAFQADPENEELKTSFESVQEKYSQAQSNYGNFFKSEGDWPDDWRDKYLEKVEGDDEAKEKLSKRLGRYASPVAALDALIAAQNKISSGDMSSKLPDNPTDTELAEYRKENGIPEESSDYKIELADGLTIGDEDKPIIDNFLAAAHADNFSPKEVNTVLNWYYNNEDTILAERHEKDLEYKDAAHEELRAEWGADYKSNTNAIENYFADAPDGLYDAIRFGRAPDGTPIGLMPDALRFFASKARASNPASTLVPGTGEAQLDNLQEEITAIEKEMGTKEWYKDKAKQERYMKLISARDKIKG
jgi:hypothetical protein